MNCICVNENGTLRYRCIEEQVVINTKDIQELQKILGPSTKFEIITIPSNQTQKIEVVQDIQGIYTVKFYLHEAVGISTISISNA